MYSLHTHTHTQSCKQVWFGIQVSGCKWQAAEEGHRYGTGINMSQTAITNLK